MRTKGKLTTWNDKKGFGFVTPNAGGKPVFIHIKAFGNRNLRPEINRLVTYALATDKQGRLCAINATLAGDRLKKKTKEKNGRLSIMGATIFLVIVAVSVLLTKIPFLLLAVYMVASILTFIVYAVDKSAAEKGAWRTQENTLHLLALAGGWPGALIAQKKLHHKSRKQSFLAVFWITVLLNGGVFIWLFTPTGAAILKSLIASIV